MGTMVALLFIVIGTAFVVRAILKLLRDRILASRGALAQGRIVAKSAGHDSDWALIAFDDGRGHAHQFRSDLAQPSGTIQVGAAVTVRYDPRNPRRAHEVSKPGSRAFNYFILFAGGLVGVYGGLMMLCDGINLLCDLPR